MKQTDQWRGGPNGGLKPYELLVWKLWRGRCRRFEDVVPVRPCSRDRGDNKRQGPATEAAGAGVRPHGPAATRRKPTTARIPPSTAYCTTHEGGTLSTPVWPCPARYATHRMQLGPRGGTLPAHCVDGAFSSTQKGVGANGADGQRGAPGDPDPAPLWTKVPNHRPPAPGGPG